MRALLLLVSFLASLALSDERNRGAFLKVLTKLPGDTSMISADITNPTKPVSDAFMAFADGRIYRWDTEKSKLRLEFRLQEEQRVLTAIAYDYQAECLLLSLFDQSKNTTDIVVTTKRTITNNYTTVRSFEGRVSWMKFGLQKLRFSGRADFFHAIGQTLYSNNVEKSISNYGQQIHTCALSIIRYLNITCLTEKNSSLVVPSGYTALSGREIRSYGNSSIMCDHSLLTVTGMPEGASDVKLIGSFGGPIYVSFKNPSDGTTRLARFYSGQR